MAETGRTIRILVAEDDAIVALGLRMVLNEHGFDVVEVVRTGPQAVRASAEHRPDLALLDVRLAEGTSGLEAGREIQACTGTPVIFVTGHLTPAEAHAVGAAGWLGKPFQPGQLVAVIRSVLARKAGGAPEAGRLAS